MRVFVASKTLDLTRALREFAHRQAGKLDKLNLRITKTQIFVDQWAQKTKQDRNALVKCVVSLPGKTVVIKHKAYDMYEAIVAATDKIVRQVRKIKEKRRDQERRNNNGAN